MTSPQPNPYDPQQEYTVEPNRNLSYSTGTFQRDPDNKVVAGICSALAQRTGWDLNLVRAGTAVLTVITSGTALLVYLVLWAVIPARDAQTTAFNEALKEGRRLYEQQKSSRQDRPHPADPDPYNLYKD